MAHFPEYRQPSITPLKQYGYMEVMSEILKYNSEEVRVLEFGHMFCNDLLLKFQDKVEMWGIDDVGNEPYIPQGEEWERHYRFNITEPCKNARLVRGYLGRDLNLLPMNYFNFVCSVSVYDNIPHEAWTGVTRHAFDLLKPGGRFINSLDYPMKHQDSAIERFLSTQREAGFEVADLSPPPEADQRLIESQFAVIHWYQMAEPEQGRTYAGNYGTVLTVARKPLSASHN